MPSSLVVALVRFVESENEALAGDLAEEFRAGRSRRWFWSQLLRAVVLVALQKGSAGFVLSMLAAVAALGVWSVTLVRHGYLEGVITSSLAGGVLIALLIFRRAAKPSDLPTTIDPFARTVFSVDTLNYSHIRVAGLGGASLVVVSAAMALQYQLTTAALALGLLGGMVGAVGLIIVRRPKTLS